jgi:phage shock protein C
MGNRLYRSRSDRMIGGVCGGLARYLSIDPILVRIFFVLLTITGSFGFWLYVLLWVIVPDETQEDRRIGFDNFEDRAKGMGEDVRQAVRSPNTNGVRLVGIVLICFGAFLLLTNLHIPWLAWLSKDLLLPILVIIAGAVLLFRALKKPSE